MVGDGGAWKVVEGGRMRAARRASVLREDCELMEKVLEISSHSVVFLSVDRLALRDPLSSGERCDLS